MYENTEWSKNVVGKMVILCARRKARLITEGAEDHRDELGASSSVHSVLSVVKALLWLLLYRAE
jgi:hypothetical protein